MKFLKTIPDISQPPKLISGAELNDLISMKDYDAIEVDSFKSKFIINHVSEIIYRGCGQLFKPATLDVHFLESPKIGNITDPLFGSPTAGNKTIKMPYRLRELTAISLDGIPQLISDFIVTSESIQLKSGSLAPGEWLITGEFGYSDEEGVPASVMTAISYLLEDVVYGDKFDRMHSNAAELKLGKMEIVRKESDFGEITGFEEVDRTLNSFKWINSPIMRRTGSIINMTAL